MTVQPTVFYIIGVTAIIILLLVWVNRKLVKYDPLSKPTPVVTACLMAYDFVYKMVRKETNDEMTEQLAPYFAAQMLYIFFASISGLIGFQAPTSNWSVTLTISLITCVMIEYYSFKYNGSKKYFKNLMEPFAPFIVLNVISKISTLASLSFRLFGNILSGSVIMSLIYSMLAALSGVIPVIGKFNFIGVFIAPVLHAYFDLFSGGMQTYLFTILSVIFIGKELPTEAKKKED
ncbi:MAG: F0F1 ATP synthase subunit A [Erysipelotrichaceae bacterium]|nr:F0F1 ATP synthase subunit A [Erysipelotrichaceae bacterium]